MEGGNNYDAPSAAPRRSSRLRLGSGIADIGALTASSSSRGMYAQYLANAAQTRKADAPRPGLSGDGSGCGSGGGNSTENLIQGPATGKEKNENSDKQKEQKKDDNQKKPSTEQQQTQPVQQNPSTGIARKNGGDQEHGVVVASTSGDKGNKQKKEKKDDNQKKPSTEQQQTQPVQQNPNTSRARAKSEHQQHGVAVASNSGSKNSNKQRKQKKDNNRKKPSTEQQQTQPVQQNPNTGMARANGEDQQHGVAVASSSDREGAQMQEMSVNDVAGTYAAWGTIESGGINWFGVPETSHPTVLAALRNSVFPLNRLAAAGYILREGERKLRMRRGRATKIKRSYITAPTHNTTARSAITIDCEMCLVSGRHDDITYLSAIDYLTGEILINNFVFPTSRILEYRTSKSGVSESLIENARQAGTLITGGFEEARERLLKFMDKNTVLVGYALHHDLTLLGIVHGRVVDGALWAAEATMGLRGKAGLWISLRQVCQEELGIEIQKNEKGGHSAVEDAMAAREIVLKWSLRPEARIRWVQGKRGGL